MERLLTLLGKKGRGRVMWEIRLVDVMIGMYRMDVRTGPGRKEVS